jgi:hypothetical protein
MALLTSVVAIGLGACGGSSQTSSVTSNTPTASPAGGGGASPSANGASPAVTISTCTLLTASQVSALLGEAPMGSGNEHVFYGNYKSCTWFGSNTSNTVSVAVNICDCSENQGFSNNSTYGTPNPYPGVGDKATLATNGSAGMFAAAFSAVKGRVAIDLYFQSPVDPNTVKGTLSADVQQILPQFS